VIRVLVDELDDPYGDQPYEESPGVWICRRCSADIYHQDSLCRHCKRADTMARKFRFSEELNDEQ
jgi:ribosomal protein L40E